MTTPLYLMAVSKPEHGHWMAVAEASIRAAGLNALADRQRLLIWRSPVESAGQVYADGWVFRRIWLAPRRSALGLLAQRFYFSSNDREPDHRPENQILAGRQRPATRIASDELTEQWAVLQRLRNGLGEDADTIVLDMVDDDLGSARKVSVNGCTVQSPPVRLNDLYRDHGFDEVDLDFTIVICPMRGVSAMVAKRFAAGISSCCKSRSLAVRTSVFGIEAIKRRSCELDSTGEVAKVAHCVLFILPAKGCTLDEESAVLFAALERNGIPFRRAYADDPLEYSIPDQLPSLIMAAGGVPHQAECSVRGMPIWTVGVDLGHGLGESTSNLVMTLVEPAGKLKGAWSIVQPRDETARDGNIALLLQHCRNALFEMDQNPNVLVLRDGRLFENETSELYRNLLTGDLTLVELRKRGNPQMFGDKFAANAGVKPIAAMVPSSNTVFAVTAPSRSAEKLPKVSKITWRDEWNRLGLSHREIARLITASAAAPGLGLHPRQLPAAVYWADGIAGTNREDLRFRGISVQSLDP